MTLTIDVDCNECGEAAVADGWSYSGHATAYLPPGWSEDTTGRRHYCPACTGGRIAEEAARAAGGEHGE